jgi:hypothetical protein
MFVFSTLLIKLSQVKRIEHRIDFWSCFDCFQENEIIGQKSGNFFWQFIGSEKFGLFAI